MQADTDTLDLRVVVYAIMLAFLLASIGVVWQLL